MHFLVTRWFASAPSRSVTRSVFVHACPRTCGPSMASPRYRVLRGAAWMTTPIGAGALLISRWPTGCTESSSVTASIPRKGIATQA